MLSFLRIQKIKELIAAALRGTYFVIYFETLTYEACMHFEPTSTLTRAAEQGRWIIFHHPRKCKKNHPNEIIYDPGRNNRVHEN